MSLRHFPHPRCISGIVGMALALLPVVSTFAQSSVSTAQQAPTVNILTTLNGAPLQLPPASLRSFQWPGSGTPQLPHSPPGPAVGGEAGAVAGGLANGRALLLPSASRLGRAMVPDAEWFTAPAAPISLQEAIARHQKLVLKAAAFIDLAQAHEGGDALLAHAPRRAPVRLQAGPQAEEGERMQLKADAGLRPRIGR